MKNTIIGTTALSLSMLMSSCVNIENAEKSESQKAEAAITTITQTMRVGESRVITMPSNPTTGYSWNVAKTPSLCSVDIKASTLSDMAQLGSATVENITITGKKVGEEVIELRYSRPWENAAVDPNDTRTMRVIITN